MFLALNSCLKGKAMCNYDELTPQEWGEVIGYQIDSLKNLVEIGKVTNSYSNFGSQELSEISGKITSIICFLIEANEERIKHEEKVIEEEKKWGRGHRKSFLLTI